MGDATKPASELPAPELVLGRVLTVRDDSGETGLATLEIYAREPGIPPDPSDIALRLEGAAIPPFGDLVAFLHSSGPRPTS